MNKLLRALKDALFPPHCAFCGAPCGPSRYCGCELPLHPTPHHAAESTVFADAVFAPFLYRGGVRKAIIDLKRNRIRDNYLPLARFMCDTLRLARFSCDVVTCVPIGKESLFEREFDQSQLLARYIASDLGIDYRDTLLRRSDKIHQKELSAQQRIQNIAGKFSLRSDADVAGRHVLLVDDVRTTGATAEECARVLKAAGAVRVSVCCAAVTSAADER
ncbi:MAG: ComF family protein [Clostridia bacterium]|nr:ComF family protein [Clostridia bacterium]